MATSSAKMSFHLQTMVRKTQCLYHLTGKSVRFPVRVVGSTIDAHQGAPRRSLCTTSTLYSRSVVCSIPNRYDHTPQYDLLQQSSEGVHAVRWSSDSSSISSGKSTGKYLDMRKYNTLNEATSMVYSQLDELNPRNLSSFWTRVFQFVSQRAATDMIFDKKKQKDTDEQLQAIFTKTMDDISSFSPRDMAQTAHSFAKIIQRIDSNNGMGMSLIQHNNKHHHDILHEILIGDNQKRFIFHTIANISVPILPKFESRYLSNLAYAYALVGSVPILEDGKTLFDHITEQCIPLLHTFNPQDMSNIVWAYEQVGLSNSVLFEEVAKVIVSSGDLNTFNHQALSNILLAFAKAEAKARAQAKETNPTTKEAGIHAIEANPTTQEQTYTTNLFDKVADHIVTLDNLEEYTPQSIANIAWSFATAGEENPDLFDEVAQHILNTNDLHSFKAQELSNILWAFASSKQTNYPLFIKAADHIVLLNNMHDYNAQNCGNIFWAFGTSNISHNDLFEKVAQHVMKNIDFKNLDENVQRNLLRGSQKAMKVRGKGEQNKA